MMNKKEQTLLEEQDTESQATIVIPMHMQPVRIQACSKLFVFSLTWPVEQLQAHMLPSLLPE